MNKYINVFVNPQYYRKILLGEKLLDKRKIKKINGKSLICVFFTSYCGVGCPFCFFHSPKSSLNINELESLENHLNADAVNKFIAFANAANVGYLQISGGGEPFLEKQAILKCLEKEREDKTIILVSHRKSTMGVADKVIAM